MGQGGRGRWRRGGGRRGTGGGTLHMYISAFLTDTYCTISSCTGGRERLAEILDLSSAAVKEVMDGFLCKHCE